MAVIVDSQATALRSVQYATTQAIRLLSALDVARAQLTTLCPGENGNIIEIPGNALSLNQAVEIAFQHCREVVIANVPCQLCGQWNGHSSICVIQTNRVVQ